MSDLSVCQIEERLWDARWDIPIQALTVISSVGNEEDEGAYSLIPENEERKGREKSGFASFFRTKLAENEVSGCILCGA